MWHLWFIRVYMLRSCPEIFFILYNLSLESGSFLSVWQHAYIIPRDEGYFKEHIMNYRPISITSMPCRNHLDELVINFFQKYYHFAITLPLVVTNLLSFVKTKVNALHCIRTLVRRSLKQPTSYLIHKLSVYGVSGTLFPLITSYVDDRTQQMKTSRRYSTVCNVTSDVPQGSILDPFFLRNP